MVSFSKDETFHFSVIEALSREFVHTTLVKGGTEGAKNSHQIKDWETRSSSMPSITRR